MPVQQYDRGDTDQVTVQNDSDIDIDFKWAMQVFKVPAGSRVTMPYNAMKVYLGDPKTQNREEDPQRRLEFYRIRGKFGIGAHNEHELKRTPGRLPESGLPDIKAFTPSGEEIPTVLVDPEGKRNAGSIINESLADQVAELRAELERVKAGREDDTFDADEDYDGPPTDLLDPEPKPGEPPVDTPRKRKAKAGTITDGKAQMGALAP